MELKRCLGCLAAPNTTHSDGCDWARCPDCGEQLILCCEHDDPTRPAMWHGVDPRDEVARQLGWWTTVVGIDRPVGDATRVVIAHALGQLTWNKETPAVRRRRSRQRRPRPLSSPCLWHRTMSGQVTPF
jgi:hypothetical protein